MDRDSALGYYKYTDRADLWEYFRMAEKAVAEPQRTPFQDFR